MYKNKIFINGYEGYIIADKDNNVGYPTFKDMEEEYRLTAHFNYDEGIKLFDLVTNTIVNFKYDDKNIDTNVAIDCKEGGYSCEGREYLVDLILKKRS